MRLSALGRTIHISPLRLDEALVREAGLARLFHDVGKLAITYGILQKHVQLEQAEFEFVRHCPSSEHLALMSA